MNKPRTLAKEEVIYTAETIDDFQRNSKRYISKQGVNKYLKDVYSSLLEKEKSGEPEDRKRAIWAYELLKEVKIDKPLIVPEALIKKPRGVS